MSKLEYSLWAVDFVIGGLGWILGGPYAGILCFAIAGLLIFIALTKKEESGGGKRILIDEHTPYIRGIKLWHRLGLGLSILAVVALICYGVYRYYQKNVSGDEIEGSIISWGNSQPIQIQVNPPRVIGGPAQSEVVINGSLLKAYQAKYKIVTLATKNDGTKSILDRPALKSSIYDIKDEPIHTYIQWDDNFIRLLAAGWQGTGYTLLVCPLGTTPDQFTTHRQAFALGCKKLKGVSGPP